MSLPKLSTFDLGCGWIAESFRRKLSNGTELQAGPAKLPPPLSLPSLEALRSVHEYESQRYAARFRSAFLVNFLLGLAAVAIALVPLTGLLDEHAMHALAPALTVMEMACIFSILLLHLAGREQPHHVRFAFLAHFLPFAINQSWRSRWVEERLYAEQLRYGELFIGFPGEVVAPGHDSSHLLDMGLDSAFRRWYLREGSACPPQPLTGAYMAQYRAYLCNLMEDQCIYHGNTAKRCHQIHHRLHVWATRAFTLTIVGCVLHLVWHAPLLSVLAAFLPAFAATCHGILSAGEYAKLGDVSRQMQAALVHLRHRIDGIDEDSGLPAAAALLRGVLLELYELTISEARGWHLAMRDKDIQVG